MARASVIVIVALVGCGSSTMSPMSDLASPPLRDLAVAPSSDLAMAPMNKVLCDNACAQLAACGVTNTPTCSSDCQNAGAAFAACLQQAINCNQIALCQFKAAGPAICGAGQGVPSGSSTCNAAATCETNCVRNSLPLSCSCPCWSGLNPALTINLTINNSCAVAKCTSGCFGQTGAAFVNCCHALCTSENAQCMSN